MGQGNQHNVNDKSYLLNDVLKTSVAEKICEDAISREHYAFGMMLVAV